MQTNANMNFHWTLTIARSAYHSDYYVYNELFVTICVVFSSFCNCFNK